MISNKLLKKVFIFAFILLLITVLTIVFLNLFLKVSKPETTEKDKVSISVPVLNPLDKSNNNFPFPLSQEQIDQSLMQNQEIVISSVKTNWPDEINDSLLKNGWKLISLSRANDGGSVIYYYFKTKNTPALSINYHWDMFKGQFQSLSLNFIHPAKIGAWLINNKPHFENTDVDIESLMECLGILYETSPGISECIK